MIFTTFYNYYKETEGFLITFNSKSVCLSASFPASWTTFYVYILLYSNPLLFICFNLIEFFYFCRYQPPIPSDLVKPWVENDHDGGKSINLLFTDLIFLNLLMVMISLLWM